jgi:hypothetical protein
MYTHPILLQTALQDKVDSGKHDRLTAYVRSGSKLGRIDVHIPCAIFVLTPVSWADSVSWAAPAFVHRILI